MAQQPLNEPSQNLSVGQDASLQDAQIGGVAGRDLNVTQVQGNVVHLTVYDSIRSATRNNGQIVHLPTPVTSLEPRQRQVLLNKVQKFWIEGVLENSLHHKTLIELGLEKRSDALSQPFDDVEAFSESSRVAVPEGTPAETLFADMGAGRTLLILGEPGSGKTITLLKLAKHLIEETEDNVNQPFPVVFNLSSWALKQQTLFDWLIDELNHKYQVSAALGKNWLQDQQLLLLLDGLDEVQTEHRPACVEAINQFLQAYGLTEIVVCSRLQEYEALPDRLKLQDAICIQPLSPVHIDRYLSHAGNQLGVLRELLNQDSAIQTLAQSPLMLSIMSLAYQNYETAESLQNLSLADHRHHLFDTYVQKMLNRRVAKRTYSEAEYLKWLSWMARNMVERSQTMFLIEEIQPNILKSGIQKTKYYLGVFLSAFLSGILLIVPGYILTYIVGQVLNFDNSNSIFTQVLFAISYAFCVALVVSLRNRNEIQTIETLKWSTKRAWRGFWSWSWRTFKIGLFSGLGLGTLAAVLALLTGQLAESLFGIERAVINEFLGQFLGVIVAVSYTLITYLLAGLIVGLVFGGITMIGWGPIGGLIKGFSGPTIAQKSQPNQGIYRTAYNAGYLALWSWLIYIFLFALVFSLIGALAGKFLLGLLGGIFVGTVSGLAIAASTFLIAGSALIRHFVLRVLLVLEGVAPSNYTRFLDYATEQIFLQKVGGGYIFIHRMLLEHFAEMDR